MKKLFLLLVSAALLFSCNKGVTPIDELSEVLDTTIEKPWITTWKLMKAHSSGPIISNPGEEHPGYDYTNLNVTFEFKTDNVLIVKGKMNHPDWSIGFEESPLNINEGTYTYSIGQETTNWLYLTIDNKSAYITYNFVVREKTMSIGLTGIGGLLFEEVWVN